MERDTYLILRVTPPEREEYEPIRSYEWRPEEAPEETPAPGFQVEARTLNLQDVREARSDPRITVARPMPLRLIAPVAAPEPTGGAPGPPPPIDGATWGVLVTGALQSPYVGHGVTVAVLDTGIDADHEAFHGVELIQRDFTGEGNGDQDGHGTHVAGTIFGRTVAGVRYGVAPGVRRALIGKVLGEQRSATTKELVEAIQWAVDQGAHVINMSLGFDFPGLVQAWREDGMPVDLATSKALALYRDNVRFFDRLMGLLRAQSARFRSALVVAAAGNESRRQIDPDYGIDVAPPGAAEGVISVAALASADSAHETLTVAPFSNIGAVVAGPGVGIYSARAGGGFTYLSGTSMASPHVTGVAALWAERQIERRRMVNVSALAAQLQANAQWDRLSGVSYTDVGEGLASAPR